MEKALPTEYDMEQLRWQCRRGMLELDYLLEDFLLKHFPSLDAEQQQQFVELLTCDDPQLNSWLLDGQTPDDMAMQSITAIIKQSVA